MHKGSLPDSDRQLKMARFEASAREFARRTSKLSKESKKKILRELSDVSKEDLIKCNKNTQRVLVWVFDFVTKKESEIPSKRTKSKLLLLVKTYKS